MSLPISKRISITKAKLPPCCLRIHPTDTSKIIIGTYQLEKETGLRHGSIDLYEYVNQEITLIKSIPTSSAVLDLKFSLSDDSIIYSAHSTGNLMIWKLNLDELTISLIDDKKIFDNDTLITSIFVNPLNPHQVLATLTTGELAIINLNDYSYVILNNTHELECWTGSFGELGYLQNVVYTGGDDAQLIAHDLRTNDKIWSTSYRHHDAGIVSILSPNENWNLNKPHQLWTGSYDDNLRILDLRLMDPKNPSLIEGFIPKVSKQENLGGGVWRLIPSPLANDDTIMSCCMYDGARIIEPKDENNFEVTRYFKGDHESMCYGGDWSLDGKFIATCSFYDNVVQVWSPYDIE